MEGLEIALRSVTRAKIAQQVWCYEKLGLPFNGLISHNDSPVEPTLNPFAFSL